MRLVIPQAVVGDTYHFNPRTREGCDLTHDARFVDSDAISIHAPVKGATVVLDFLTTFCTISIHAPVKGATRVQAFAPCQLDISIHAPVKGATENDDAYLLAL